MRDPEVLPPTTPAAEEETSLEQLPEKVDTQFTEALIRNCHKMVRPSFWTTRAQTDREQLITDIQTQCEALVFKNLSRAELLETLEKWFENEANVQTGPVFQPLPGTRMFSFRIPTGHSTFRDAFKQHLTEQKEVDFKPIHQEALARRTAELKAKRQKKPVVSPEQFKATGEELAHASRAQGHQDRGAFKPRNQPQTRSFRRKK